MYLDALFVIMEERNLNQKEYTNESGHPGFSIFEMFK